MRYHDIDISLLRCLVCIAEQGSFTAASHLLELTQSAVSLKVKRLEDVMGKRIFERTSRHIELTRDGAMLLNYARRILALNDEAIRTLLAAPVQGQLRIGVAECFLTRRLPAILAEFTSEYPAVQLDVQTGRGHELRAAHDQGHLDVTIGDFGGTGRMGRAFATEEVVWIAAENRKIAEGDTVFLTLRTPGCVFREKALTALRMAGIPYRIAYTAPSLPGVVAAVEAGLGVTVAGCSMLGAGLTKVDVLPPLRPLEISSIGSLPEDNPLADLLLAFIRRSLPTGVVASPIEPEHQVHAQAERNGASVSINSFAPPADV